jgi:AcrR family transcriptional regulator
MATMRERVRAQMTDEIKACARRQLATEGANLSLRAISREMGIASSALYRYFASRDDLLTALIIDAYNSLGGSVEAAEATVKRDDYAERWSAIAHTIRSWAIEHKHEYLLIYGSPVPGYSAPEDTIEPASRAVTVFIAMVQEAGMAGAVEIENDHLPPGLAADLRQVLEEDAPEIAVAMFARGVAVWLELFGHINFELTGQLLNTISDYDAFFDYQVQMSTQRLGLTPRR